MTTNTTVQHRERAHPSPTRYTVIAIILAVVTLIEVAIVYQKFMQPVLIPVLLILSTGKFVTVAMFYMHLRFDNRLFSIMFVSGILLAAAVMVALLTLFGVFSF